MPTIDEYTPLRVEPVYVKSKLPGDVWRLLSTAAVPDRWGTLRPVVVDEKGTSAAVLTAEHYEALMYRLHDLERAVTEATEGAS